MLVQENVAAQDIQSVLKKQNKQIAEQQKQIVSASNRVNVSSHGGGQRRHCWCDFSDHLRKDCPKKAKDAGAATPPAQPDTLGKNFKRLGPLQQAMQCVSI